MDEILTKHLDLLNRVFGFQEFRGLQWPVIRCLHAGTSALAIFPTGAGKSLCYQLPALIDHGLTLVISPLIALMNDQVTSLQNRNVAAEKLDSTIPEDEAEKILQRIQDQKIRILFLSPERLAQRSMAQFLRQQTIATLVIDEAHCISEWGHNFRPDYLKIARSTRRLGVQKVLALTATATQQVKRDIARAFKIHTSHIYQASPHRPNLCLQVHPCLPHEKDDLLLDRLQKCQGCTIVYAATRRDTERLAAILRQQKFSVRAYHAGLTTEARNSAQTDFMTNRVSIIVATIAFGMGIDKPDIRNVIHYHMPKSIEGYSQEIGRAGRDGKPATCAMLASLDDARIHENHIFGSTPTPNALKKLMDSILRYAMPGKEFSHSPYDLSITHDLREETIATVLALLDLHKVIEPRGSYRCFYRVKLLRPLNDVLAGRPSKEKSLVKTIIESATQQYGIYHVDLLAVAASTKTKREVISNLLNELEKANDIHIEQRGLRTVYRLLATWDGDRAGIVERLTKIFESREAYEHGRIASMVKWVNTHKCRVQRLSQYFGWKDAESCGHCDNCLPLIAGKMKATKVPRISDQQWEMVRALRRENHPALSTPHQLTRYLCGISSPASLKARLHHREEYGMWQEHRFREILAMMNA